jgi:hypothetical protein
MLESGSKPADRLSLERAHALTASGAEGPGFVGVLHPTSSEISAALSALGVYADVPSERELAEQALAVGGESVLAAVVRNRHPGPPQQTATDELRTSLTVR